MWGRGTLVGTKYEAGMVILAGWYPLVGPGRGGELQEGGDTCPLRPT